MKNNTEFQICSVAELATVSGGDKLITDRGPEKYWTDDNGVALSKPVPGAKAPQQVNKRNPLCQVGKPSGWSPLPRCWIGGNAPYIHFD